MAYARLAAATIAAASGTAWMVRAQDIPDDYYTKVDEGLEYRVFEGAGVAPDRQGLPQIRLDLGDGGHVRLYGHVNMGLQHVDDGKDSETSVPLDNANSVTRLGVHVERPLEQGWKASARVEVGYAPYGSFRINQVENDPDFTFNENNIRWIDFNLHNPRYGAVSVGQGAMATAGVAFTDFSDTQVIAASAPADSAGAQFLRPEDALLPVDAGPTVGRAYSNFDGFRRVRVRYDTPTYMGLGATAAYGRNLLTTNNAETDEDLFDIALTYGGQTEDFRFGAAVGYFWDRFDREIAAGSASVLHKSTGLSFSVAAGALDTDNAPTASYAYGKLGLTRDILSVGRSAVSIDYYDGEDIATAGSDSRSVGFAAVQFVDSINSEFWLTWRVYDYDEPGRNFEDLQVVFGGVRFRF